MFIWLIFFVLVGWQICVKLDIIIEKFSKVDKLFEIVDELKTLNRKIR